MAGTRGPFFLGARPRPTLWGCRKFSSRRCRPPRPPAPPLPSVACGRQARTGDKSCPQQDVDYVSGQRRRRRPARKGPRPGGCGAHCLLPPPRQAQTQRQPRALGRGWSCSPTRAHPDLHVLPWACSHEGQRSARRLQGALLGHPGQSWGPRGHWLSGGGGVGGLGLGKGQRGGQCAGEVSFVCE